MSARKQHLKYYDESDEYYSDVDYFYDEREDYDKCQTKLEKLKSVKEMVDLEVEEDRSRFYRLFNELIVGWKHQLPDLREVFQRQEIDLLLLWEIHNYGYTNVLNPLIEFVVRTGYKDEPELDEDGKPVLRRTTALHRAGRDVDIMSDDPNIPKLFQIYGLDVNYIDESGFTHFRVACIAGCCDIVEKFLDQDPNLLVSETGYSPLRFAWANEHKNMFKLLLQHGADLNVADKNGSSILHLLSKRNLFSSYDDEWIKIIFEVTDEKHQLVPVHARDKLGRTPLHSAVANLMPDPVEILLDHGADVSNYVFPNYKDYDDSLDNLLGRVDGMVEISACTLVIVECLEKKGYEMSRSDVVSIMKLFNKHGLFDNFYETDFEYCLRNEEFAKKSKKLMINTGLSFYDSIFLSPKETRKRITCKDYLRFVCSNEWMKINTICRDDCMIQLSIKMWRGFCCRWGLEVFYELINGRLPILCCQIIVDKLINEDLMNLCLAAEIDSKKQS